MTKIFKVWLQGQYEEGMALAEASDLLELIPLDGPPPQKYVARFRCKGMVRSDQGEVTEADRFDVGIWFPLDYQRRANLPEVLTWLGPDNAFHPNINPRPIYVVTPPMVMPATICIGSLNPGMELKDILYQCFEIIGYNKVTMREDDALNKDACVWARNNQHRFPIDGRPLRRRSLDLCVETIEELK